MNFILDQIPSKVIAEAVAQFSKLPGIGTKTAIRLVLHLVRQEKDNIQQLAQSITDLHEQLKTCQICHCISDDDICSVCAHPQRNKSLICVVEDFRDMISIESTGQFNGVYHILGGLISPLDGISPDVLNITSLINRCAQQEVEELIMALSPSIEGDTTSFFITKQLKNSVEKDIKITSIARGIAFGGEIEYADEVTLGKALNKRLPMDTYIDHNL